jgi:hypothetical protein
MLAYQNDCRSANLLHKNLPHILFKTNEGDEIVPVVKNYAVEAYKGSGNNLHPFLSSALDCQFDDSKITPRRRREFLNRSEYRGQMRNAVLECN